MCVHKFLDEWEALLTREKMPKSVGYESERHGEERYRVLSLNVYAYLEETGRAWAVWDRYGLELEETDTDPADVLEKVPEVIQRIGRKRVMGVALTATERSRLKRFRDGTYHGQPGCPKNRNADGPDSEGSQRSNSFADQR